MPMGWAELLSTRSYANSVFMHQQKRPATAGLRRSGRVVRVWHTQVRKLFLRETDGGAVRDTAPQKRTTRSWKGNYPAANC
jgi:hypothetical protein